MMTGFAGTVAIDRFHILIEGEDPRIDRNFFAQFAQCRALQIFSGLDEAARKRKSAHERGPRTLGEEDKACPEYGEAYAKAGTVWIIARGAGLAGGPRGA